MAQTSASPNICGILVFQPDFKQIYCRLCLSTFNAHYKKLFSPFNSTETIVEVVQDLANVSILKDDGHSKLICIGCFNRLTETQNFKSLIGQSDYKLRNQLVACKKPVETGVIEENVGETKPVLGKDEINCGRELLRNSSNSGEESNDFRDSEDNEEQQLDVGAFVKTEIEDIEINEIKVECNQEELIQNGAKILENNNNNKTGINNRTIKVKKKRIKKIYRLECPHCDMIFKRHEDRKRHLIKHTGNYPHHCSICNKGFVGIGELKNHEPTHTGEKKYQCETCGKSFKQAPNLLTHRKTHLDEKPFKCDQCDKEFKSKATLTLHMAVHTSNPDESSFFCEICNKTYLTKDHLRNHMRKSHKPREFVSCTICGQSVLHYSEHMKSHTKPHKCSVCNQGFANQTMLKAHSAVHTGQRLFECDLCGKTFRFQGSLHTHRKTHDLTKRPKCDICDKQFIYNQQLKKHLEKVHQKT